MDCGHPRRLERYNPLQGVLPPCLRTSSMDARRPPHSFIWAKQTDMLLVWYDSC